MAPNSAGGVTRASATAKAAVVTATTKPREETTPSVTDVNTAMEFLITGDLKAEDDEMSFEFLSVIAMQLAQQSRFSKHASDALRALSFLIHDLEKRCTVSEITDVVAKAVRIATKRVRNELKEDRKSTRLNSSHAIPSRMPSSA